MCAVERTRCVACLCCVGPVAFVLICCHLQDFEKSKGLLKALPTWVLRHVVAWVGFLGAELGLSVPCLGVRPFPFGSCMVG